jgi:hypothetical protein
VLSRSDGRLSTVTQVKVWSLEKADIALGEGIVHPEASIATCVKGEHDRDAPGSQATVGNRIARIGTWESPIAPEEASNKPKRRRRKYGDKAVGPVYSRGVGGVMPIESPSSPEGTGRRT